MKNCCIQALPLVAPMHEKEDDLQLLERYSCIIGVSNATFSSDDVHFGTNDRAESLR